MNKIDIIDDQQAQTELDQLSQQKVLQNQILQNINEFSLFQRSISDHLGSVLSVCLIREKIFSASSDNTIRVFNIRDQAKDSIIMRGHTDQINSLSLSPDSKKLASGSNDKTIRIWNLENFSQIAILLGHENSILQVQISLDGKKIISACKDGRIFIWDCKSFKQITNFQDQNGRVNAICLTSDSKKMISGGEDKIIRIWNIDTMTLEDSLLGHQNAILSIAVTSDGKKILSGGKDKVLKIWDIEQKRIEESMIGHIDYINSICVTSDSKRVISGSRDKTIRIWNIEFAQQEFKLEGHTDGINSIFLSQDGKSLVSGSDDKTIKIWQLESNQKESELKNHKDVIHSMCLSKDGQRLISGGSDKTIRIWNLFSQQQIAVLEGHQGSVLTLCLTQDESKILSGSSDNTIRVWNNNDGKLLGELKGHTSQVMSVCSTFDEKLIISGSDDYTIRIWDQMTFQQITIIEGHSDRVNCVYVTKDSSRLVSGSRDNTIRVWNLNSFKLIKVLEGNLDSVNVVCLTQDEKYIISGSEDKVIRIWNFETYSYILALEGHTDIVQSLCISQDGRKLISGSFDKTIRIWNLESQQLEVILEGNNGIVRSICMSQDGKKIYIASDKQIEIYNNNDHHLMYQLYQSQSFLELKLQNMSIEQIKIGIPPLPPFLIKYKNRRQYIYYPTFIKNVTQIQILLYNKKYQLLKKFLKYATINNIFVPLICDDSQSSYFDIVNNNKQIIQQLFSFYDNPNFTALIQKNDFSLNILSKQLSNFMNLRLVGVESFIESYLMRASIYDQQYQDVLNGLLSYEFENILTLQSDKKYLSEDQCTKLKLQNGQGIQNSLDIKFLNLPGLAKDNSFLKALKNYKNSDQIFNNDFVEAYLESKWQQRGKKNFTIEFIFYVFAFTVYIINGTVIFPMKIVQLSSKTKNQALIITSLVLNATNFVNNTVKAIKEIRQFLAYENKLDYLSEFWNQLDIVSITMIYVGAITGLQSSFVSDLSYLHTLQIVLSINLFLQGTRLMAFCRGFKRSSFMILLCRYIFHDIQSFLIIFGFIILIFVQSTYTVQNSTYLYSDLQVFRIFHRLIIGDPDDNLKGLQGWNEIPNMQLLVWTLFLFSHFILVIIMLNLLIALIEDSYEKVIALERQNWNFERAQILYDIEMIQGGEYVSQTNKQYIYVSKILNNFNDQLQDNQIRLRQVIENVQTNQKDLKEQITAIREQVANKNCYIDTLVEDLQNMKNEMNNFKEEADQVIKQEIDDYFEQISELLMKREA